MRDYSLGGAAPECLASPKRAAYSDPAMSIARLLTVPAQARQRGVALIAVLWVLTLLAVVATAVTVDARTDMALARNAEAGAKAEALADAGVMRAASMLMTRRPRNVRDHEDVDDGEGADIVDDTEAADTPSLAELLERRPGLEGAIERRVGSEALLEALPLVDSDWPVDGSPVALPLDGAVLSLAIQDVGGLVDLNSASEELLEGLFVAAGLSGEEAKDLAAAIRDYGDEDGLVRPGGAEAAAYRGAGLAGPKDGSFQFPQELRAVFGMTPELFEAVRPAITVWSGRPGIDPRVAPPAALAALPVGNQVQVDTLLADRVAGTERPQHGLIGADAYLSRSRGRVFAIRAEVLTEAGAVYVREAVIRISRRAGAAYQVYHWGQGRPATGTEED
jgi:general secretion pathway protein K